MVEYQNQKYEEVFGKSDQTEQNTEECRTKTITLLPYCHNSAQITSQYNNLTSESKDAGSNNDLKCN